MKKTEEKHAEDVFIRNYLWRKSLIELNENMCSIEIDSDSIITVVSAIKRFNII